MIQTALGLPTSRKDKPIYKSIQDWMHSNGLSPYMPQLQYNLSYNLALSYDPIYKGLSYRSGNPYGWTQEMIDEVERFNSKMVFSYGNYYYNSRPATLRWKGTDGIYKSQDELSLDQISEYLNNSLEWFRQNGIIDPYIFVDEPPHRADDGMGGIKYGWSPALEARVIKFITAARKAGWKVHVANNRQAIEFWSGRGFSPTPDGKPRFVPNVWVCVDKDLSLYNPILSVQAKNKTGPALWLYNTDLNVYPRYEGLSQRMFDFGATGFLQWSATTSTVKNRQPLLLTVSADESTFTISNHVLGLINELNKLEKMTSTPPPVLTLEQRMTRAETEINKILQIISNL